jgi:hypothetical protein
MSSTLLNADTGQAVGSKHPLPVRPDKYRGRTESAGKVFVRHTSDDGIIVERTLASYTTTGSQTAEPDIVVENWAELIVALWMVTPSAAGAIAGLTVYIDTLVAGNWHPIAEFTGIASDGTPTSQCPAATYRGRGSQVQVGAGPSYQAVACLDNVGHTIRVREVWTSATSYTAGSLQVNIAVKS